MPVTPAIIQTGKCYSVPSGVLMSAHSDGSGKFPNYTFLLAGRLLAKSSRVSSELLSGEKEVCALPR